MKHKMGSYFFKFETHWGSGHAGCVELYKLGRMHRVSQLTRVQGLGHTCSKKHNLSVSMRIDYYETAGVLMWIS